MSAPGAGLNAEPLTPEEVIELRESIGLGLFIPRSLHWDIICRLVATLDAAAPAVTETDLRDAEGLLADSYVANSDLRVALLRIFDLAEDRPDIRAVAREALHKKDLRVVARQAAYDTLPSDADDAMYEMAERAADAVLRALAATSDTEEKT